MARKEKEEDQKSDETPLMIIAMKGHPGTGKSTLATAIASALKIPLIDKDDVRDCTLSLQQILQHTSSSSQNPHADAAASASALLNDLSYEVIWQVAATQLNLGLSVVIDSPLSRRTHLERLTKLAGSVRAGVVVVECKPSDEVEWRRRLERRGTGMVGDGVAVDDYDKIPHQPSWHKPATWRDLQKLMEGYGGCTEYELGDVPKLTVDTTAGVGVHELSSRVIDSIFRRCTGPSVKIQ